MGEPKPIEDRYQTTKSESEYQKPEQSEHSETDPQIIECADNMNATAPSASNELMEFESGYSTHDPSIPLQSEQLIQSPQSLAMIRSIEHGVEYEEHRLPPSKSPGEFQSAAPSPGDLDN